MYGTVKWFDAQKGYGFISSNGQDYFVHWKNIESNQDYKSLGDNQEVEFVPETSDRGPVAREVRVIEV
jgi:CspA family cold shock protein